MSALINLPIQVLRLTSTLCVLYVHGIHPRTTTSRNCLGLCGRVRFERGVRLIPVEEEICGQDMLGPTLSRQLRELHSPKILSIADNSKPRASKGQVRQK